MTKTKVDPFILVILFFLIYINLVYFNFGKYK
jgi:hypothetical protein